MSPQERFIAERLAAVQAAFREGVLRYFPEVERVELAPEAEASLVECGVLSMSEAEFDTFLLSLRHPAPPKLLDE